MATEELSLEEIGLEVGEPLQTSPRQLAFGWLLVLLGFVVSLAMATVLVVLLSYAGMISFFVAAFSGFTL